MAARILRATESSMRYFIQESWSYDYSRIKSGIELEWVRLYILPCNKELKATLGVEVKELSKAEFLAYCKKENIDWRFYLQCIITGKSPFISRLISWK